MQKIDDIFPKVGIIPAMIIVVVIGIALQLSGVWITMIVAGAFGGLFTKRHLNSFLAGSLGVAIAWTILFIYLIMTAQALVIAEFFIGLLDMSGGYIVIIISIIFGFLLGGFGGLLGRSLVELLDEVIASSDAKKMSKDAEKESVTTE